MNDALPPVVVPPPIESRFARWAAILSLLAPVVMILIYILLLMYMRPRIGTQGPTFGLLAFAIIVFTPLLLLPVGVTLGIAALVSTKRSGRKSGYGMVLAGICINGVLLVLLIIPALFAVLLGPAFVGVWRQMTTP